MSVNNNLVSVIVPVYNVKNYLQKCLSSIINQTYTNLEIILVDDGSNDGSEKICETFAAKDERITVYHIKNSGQASARNYALDRCRGDYIAFVDSDDIAKENNIETLLNLAELYNTGLAVSPTQKFNENLSFENEEIYTGCASKIAAVKNLLYQKFIFHTGPHAKIYKRELFDGVRFPAGLIYEDLATIYKLFLKCRRIAFTGEKLYAYRIRQGSTMRQNYSPRMLSCIPVSQQLYKDISTKYPDLEQAAASRAFSVNRSIYLQLPHDRKQERKQVWQEMKKYRKTVIFDSHARKRERLAALLSYSGSEIFHLFAGLYKKLQMKV